tara:strand:+ start:231 stop:1076 length:846 start_codon:yes stop_codon:yes gene_type:complete
MDLLELNYKLILPLIPIVLLYYFYNKKINFGYFKDKSVLITGASSGIGKSIADILNKNSNCELHLFARSFENSNTGKVFKYKCDCSDYLSLEKIINEIEYIDIVINCAGAGDWKFLQEMDINEIQGCLNAPLISSLNLTHLTLPKMIKNNEGQMIFVQSPVVLQTWRSCTAYSVSRWGMRGLTESLRADLYNTNISISEVILGRTESNYFKNNKNADKRFPKIGNIINKITPDEAALCVLKSTQTQKSYTYYPFMLEVVVYINYLFPSIVRYITYKTSWHN